MADTPDRNNDHSARPFMVGTEPLAPTDRPDDFGITSFVFNRSAGTRLAPLVIDTHGRVGHDVGAAEHGSAPTRFDAGDHPTLMLTRLSDLDQYRGGNTFLSSAHPDTWRAVFENNMEQALNKIRISTQAIWIAVEKERTIPDLAAHKKLVESTVPSMLADPRIPKEIHDYLNSIVMFDQRGKINGIVAQSYSTTTDNVQVTTHHIPTLRDYRTFAREEITSDISAFYNELHKEFFNSDNKPGTDVRNIKRMRYFSEKVEDIEKKLARFGNTADTAIDYLKQLFPENIRLGAGKAENTNSALEFVKSLPAKFQTGAIETYQSYLEKRQLSVAGQHASPSTPEP